MSKADLEQLLLQSLQKLINVGVIPAELPAIQIDTTKDKTHGDFATNIALMLAKSAGKKPRDLAQLIVSHLPESPIVEKVDIAGPGFINFYLKADALFQVVHEILAKGEDFGKCNLGNGEKVLFEFVSTNPTGPLHVGHGRHGAYGAVVADLLEMVGYKVDREYYVNDAGRQMDILAVSVWIRYLSLFQEGIRFPDNGYKGSYIIDIANVLKDMHNDKFVVDTQTLFLNLPKDESEGGDKEVYIDALIQKAKVLLPEKSFAEIFDVTLKSILDDIREDLSEFGVNFQNWFSESAFVKTSAVNDAIDVLKKKNLTYVDDGALWFKATEFGDEKDRVLERSNGARTYFANDLAYHFNKFQRGYDRAIDLFGSDHHGYVPRMKAGLKALGIDESKLTYLLVQFVTLFRGNVQASMSTRSGTFVTLRELRHEVGNDAARFFYVMRKYEQHMEFDLELAKSETTDNPVYYVQYAHARVCSVFKQVEEKHLPFDQLLGIENLSALNEKAEIQLVTTLGKFEDMIKAAARQYEPQILTVYLRDVATDFHAYYNSHQFLVEDAKIRNARLTLILATRQILANGLKLLGVSAPLSM